MRNIKMEDEGPRLTTALLKQTECDLGIVLPTPYRNFMIHHNGGSPDPSYFRVETGKRRWIWESAADLTSIEECPDDGLVFFVNAMRERNPEDGALPRECIPINYTALHNQIIIFVEGERKGEVWIKLWDRVPNTSAALADPECELYFVAKSFDVFLGMLQDDPGNRAFKEASASQQIAQPTEPAKPKPVHRRGRSTAPARREASFRSKKFQSTKIGNVYECGRSVTKAKIAAAEKELGVQLPSDYVEFLFEANGGSPDNDVLPTKRLGKFYARSIEWFYGIDPGNDYIDLTKWTKSTKKFMPKGYVAIGCLFEENQIVIATSGRSAGRVFIWDAYSKAKDPRNRLFQVAKSFEELADLLTGRITLLPKSIARLAKKTAASGRSKKKAIRAKKSTPRKKAVARKATTRKKSKTQRKKTNRTRAVVRKKTPARKKSVSRKKISTRKK